MKKLAIATSIAIASAFSALATGFDGMNLVTNEWFAADFTADLATGSAIVANSSTGVTYGAGTWTTVPATGTAVIAADEDAGGKTMLSLEAPGEELTFTPLPYVSPSGMETFVSEIKADALDSDLPALGPEVQSAFTLFDDGEGNVSAMAWTVSGWTNFTYAASDLTNAWFTLYSDFATVGGVRYVRYSVKPASGSLAILTDASGTAWFTAATNATVVSSVSLSGTADVRKFSGDELTRVPVATYNGQEYPTVADAIAAAEEGGTVTLLKGVTEDAFAVNKNITLDFAEKTASIPYVTIAEGKTLTIQRANKQNQIGYFTGGGSLVVAGNNTFRWDSMTGTSTLASITQSYASAGISISGYGTINVLGDVNVGGTLTFTPGRITSSTANGEYTIKMSAKALSVKTLNGGATIETADGATVTSGTFYGKFTGAGELNASGGFTLQGVSAVAGKFNVNSGTVSVATRNPSSPDLRLDSSNPSNMTIADGALVAFTTPNGNSTRSWLSQGTAYVTVGTDEGYFAGKEVMFFNKNVEYEYPSGNLRYGALFAVYQKNEVIGDEDDENVLFTSKSNPGSDKLRFGIYKRGYQNRSTWYGWSNSSSQASNYNWPIYLDGSNASKNYTAGKKSVLSFASYLPDSGTRGLQLGNAGATFTGAVAEIIGLGSAVSLEERAAIEHYLMKKWDCTDAGNFVQLAATTEVFVDSGATLDLGGYTHTVASFTGGGTVQNGTLITTDNVYTNTGALSISAVNDMTIVLDAGATSLTLVGDATNVSVTATDAFIASGATITVTASAIHTEGHSIDFSGIPSDIFRYGYIDNDDGTWSVGVQTSGFTAATYIWSPVGSSTDWTSLANWSVDGYESVATLPQSVDTVVFPVSEEPGFSGWTVALGENRTVAAMRFNDATALSGALAVCSDVTAASSNVKVTLGNDAGFQDNAANLTLANMSFEVSASHENPARFYMYNNTYKIDSTCKITGTGAVTFGVERDSTGIEIKADMTEFEGKATITGARLSAYRSNTSIAQQASSSNAVWYVANGSKQSAFFSNGGVTYYFGSLSGSISHNYQSTGSDSAGFGYRMEIGNRGLDDALGGRYFSATYTSRIAQNKYQPILRKVGGGTLTFTGTEVAKYEVNGGVLYCKANSAFETYWSVEEKTQPYSASFVADGQEWHTPITFGGEGGTLKLDEAVTLDLSTNFVNSTMPISIDDGGVDRTWTGVIDSSNTDGLVKKGEGTLTLAAVPEYTGDTYLDGGKLLILKSVNITVKTHDEVKVVRKRYVTIDGKKYIEYRLGDKPAAIIYF